MACFRPLAAYRRHDGSVQVLKSVAKLGDWSGLRLPCGQCTGCRLEYSRQWAVRIMNENQLSSWSSFVTLTYRDGECPLSLEYGHFQDFMKRLRAHLAPNRCRFFMCGEYGEKYKRPHFHCVLFGVDFPDRVHMGGDLYRSPTLERLWPFGYSSIGEVTFESAAYVARYVCKKVSGKGQEVIGDDGLRPYETVLESGEIFERRPEFARMSLKPGIGAGWLEKFESDVFPHDYVVSRGVKCPLPRYYTKILSEKYPDKVAELKLLRQDKINAADCTPQRLIVREAVAEARLKLKSRCVE